MAVDRRAAQRLDVFQNGFEDVGIVGLIRDGVEDVRQGRSDIAGGERRIDGADGGSACLLHLHS